MLKVGDRGTLIKCSSCTYAKGNVSFLIWQRDRPIKLNNYISLTNFIVTEIGPFELLPHYVCYFPNFDVTDVFTEGEEDFNYVKLINFNLIWNNSNA